MLDQQGYVEIETPTLQLIHGGAAARPFRTHINAFDQEMTLRIALELNLKKAVVGGVDRVYEIGRIFRNEGVDATHSPEFTMLEAYHAYGDQSTIADLMRDLFLAVADALGSRQVETPHGIVDLDGEWRWLPVYDAVSEAVGEAGHPRDAGRAAARVCRRPRRGGEPRPGTREGGPGAARRPGRAGDCPADASCATTRPSPSRWPDRTGRRLA